MLANIMYDFLSLKIAQPFVGQLLVRMFEVMATKIRFEMRYR